MAQLLVSAAFAGVGSAMGWGIPLLGMTGAQVGWAVGSLVGNALFAEDNNIVNEGPRLDDLRVTSSAYGQMRPIGYGVYPVPGNIFDGSNLYEERHKSTQGGGKGGGGTSSTSITYTYSVDLAVGLGEGPIGGVLQVYANEQLIYDATPGSSVTQPDWLKMKVYLGSETQEADPTLEAIHGAGNVPAYRGEAYVVFERFELAEFGNRPPNFRFVVASAASELFTSSSVDLGTPVIDDNNITAITHDPRTGLIWVVLSRESTADDEPTIHAVNPYTRQIVKTWEVSQEGSDRYYSFSHAVLGSKPQVISGIWVNQPNTHLITMSRGSSGIGARHLWVLDTDTMSVAARFDVPSLRESNSPIISAYDRDLVIYADSYQNDLVRIFFWLSVGGTLSMTEQVVSLPDDWVTGGNGVLGVKAGDYGDGAVICSVLNHATDASRHAVGLFTDYRAHFGSEWVIAPAWAIVELPAGSVEPIAIQYDSATDQFVVIEEGDHTVISDGYAAPRTRVHLVSADGVLNDSVDWNGAYTEHGRISNDIIHPKFSVDSTTGDIYFSGHDGAINAIYRWNFITQEPPQKYGAGSVVGAGARWDHISATLWAGSHGDINTSAYLRGYHLNRLQAGTVSLQSVVEDVCSRRSFQPGQYDATALASRQVRGYRITRQMSGKAALQPLRTAYLFDVSKHDGVLEFIPRGQASSATLGADDLGAHPYGETPPDDITITRVDDEQLPSAIGLAYMNAGASYEQGYQLAHRLAADTETPQSVSLPLVLTDNEAAQLADILVHLPAIEREQYEVAAMPVHRDINPANVITLSPGSREHTMRVTEKTFERGVVRLRGRRDESSIYTSYISGGATINTDAVLKIGGVTLLTLLDLPLLRSADNDAGFYMAANSYAPYWPGCVVYQSHDGSDYGEIASLPDAAVMGAVRNLPAAAQPYVWDRSTALDVLLIGEGELSSVTEAQCLAEVNAAAYGAPGRWELVLFQTATLQADGSYQVSNLVRGMRGTEWAMALHEKGDQFIVLSADSMQRVAAEFSDVNQQRYFKAVTIGRSLADDTAQAQSLTLTGEALKPWAPVNTASSRDGSDNIVFTWDRQDRIKTQAFWQPQLSEDSESYEVDILDGATVLRTLTVSAATATYTAADQNTDWGGLATSFTVHVYQKSATVGRGHAGEQDISL